MRQRSSPLTPEETAALKAARSFLYTQEQEREEAVDGLAMALGIPEDRARDLFETAVSTLL